MVVQKTIGHYERPFRRSCTIMGIISGLYGAHIGAKNEAARINRTFLSLTGNPRSEIIVSGIACGIAYGIFGFLYPVTYPLYIIGSFYDHKYGK